MPRGKYVNHKGRRRHFTSPEELQQQSEDDSSSEAESDDEGADQPGGSKARGAISKQSAKAGKMPTSSEDSDESDEVDRDAKKGVAGLIEIENPNRRLKKVTQKIENISLDTKPELSRREQKQLENQKNRRRYEQLRAEGKTAEAKADLARLALIRQQRAEAAAKREAEKKAAEDKKSTSETAGSGGSSTTNIVLTDAKNEKPAATNSKVL
ncbi:28 kDa heat- and acid-stable phosphoprotein [Glossina fuscipes]|uniref:28 kDa heat- and acid-stable phosphoprotein n=1 Tax=Glossina fuscipes TaxID=7396 RepID=A0A8U0WJ23_9MUSC|nr:28 kDa heat- and acid-stable phosphoprotein [Glossina fuscipes]